MRDAGTLRFMGQGPVASAMAVSANRKRVFGMEAATGRVFEIHPKTLAPTPVVEIKQPLSGLCASPDGGRLLLLSNAKKSVHLVDTATKQTTLVSVDMTRIKSCHFALDGQSIYLVSMGADPLLTVDVKTGKESGRVSVATPALRLSELFIHPNPAKRLALVADGSRILLFDTATNKAIGPDVNIGVPIHSMAFHPNGNLVFALSDDKVFWVDLQTHQVQKNIELAPGGTFRTLAIDAQGRRLFVCGNHEMNEGLGAMINTQGKEFLVIDIETRKKTYQDYPPVQTVQFLVSP